MSSLESVINNELLGKIKVVYELSHPMYLDGTIILPGGKVAKVPIADYYFIEVKKGKFLPLFYLKGVSVKVTINGRNITIPTGLNSIDSLSVDVTNHIRNHTKNIDLDIRTNSIKDMYTIYKILSFINATSLGLEHKIMNTIYSVFPQLVGVYDANKEKVNDTYIHIFKKVKDNGRKEIIFVMGDKVVYGDESIFNIYSRNSKRLLEQLYVMIQYLNANIGYVYFDRTIVLNSEDFDVKGIIRDADDVYIFINEDRDDVFILSDGVVFRTRMLPIISHLLYEANFRYSTPQVDVHELTLRGKLTGVIKRIFILTTDKPLSMSFVEQVYENINNVSVSRTIGSRVYYSVTKSYEMVRATVTSFFARRFNPYKEKYDGL